VSGQTLRLDDNPLGWKTARLDFKGKEAELTVTTSANAQERKFPIGLDGLYRTTPQKQFGTPGLEKPKQRHFVNPYEFAFLLGAPVDGAVGMKGEWMKENQFLLTIQHTVDFDRDSLIFSFFGSGPWIVWDSNVDGSSILTLNGQFD
jgi:hypothetical protein